MAITTYAEFSRTPNTKKRYLVYLQAWDTVGLATVSFYFSNIAGDLSGFSAYFHGMAKAVPRMSYNAREIGGRPSVPAWSDLVLIREDGYDISIARTGIDMDELGNRYTVRDRQCWVWYGGEDLPFSEYQLVFKGYCDGLRRTDTEITIEVRGATHQTERLTIASGRIDAATYPNANQNTNKTKPAAIGFCWNVTPICVDYVAYTYMFHDNSQPYGVIGVYQDGVALTTPAQYVDNLNGTFTLTFVPTGLITCFVTGAYGFALWATIITNLLQNYGGVAAGDIDAAAVAAANIALPYSVGYWFSEETSVTEAVDILSEGIPAWYGFQRGGVFSMEEVTDPQGKTPDYVINNTLSNTSPVPFLDGTLSEKSEGAPVDTCNIKYYQNFTSVGEDRLSGTLTPLQKLLYSLDWRQEKYNDATVITTYPYPASVTKISHTYSQASALALATKWVNLLKTERRTTRLIVKAQDLTMNIGDIVQVTFETELFDGSAYHRHEYNAHEFMIVGIAEDYTNKTITLELWS